MDLLLEGASYLLTSAREMGYKVIFINHQEEEGPFAPDNPLSQTVSELAPLENETLIRISKLSPFFRTNLDQELKGIQNIVVAGIPTNLTVRMLVEEAYDRELNIVLIEDLCYCYSEKIHDFTLDDLWETRPWVDILRLDDFFR